MQDNLENQNDNKKHTDGFFYFGKILKYFEKWLLDGHYWEISHEKRP